MTLQLSMKAVASSEMQAVSSVSGLAALFPLSGYYSSFPLYLLQNMEDSCFLMKTISLKNHAILCKCIGYEKLQTYLVVNISCIHQCITTLLETEGCYQETESVFSSSPLSCFMHEVADTK